jgi:hypothetical protein
MGLPRAQASGAWSPAALRLCMAAGSVCRTSVAFI